MVRGKNALRSGVPKNVSSLVSCKCSTHLHLPVGHVVRAILYAAEDAVELRRQHTCICPVWVRGGSWDEAKQIPWILRNCPTFSAAPRIRVSLDTRRVKFASVIMSEDGESDELADVVERRRSSAAAP
jgi:hypothetical protein